MHDWKFSRFLAMESNISVCICNLLLVIQDLCSVIKDMQSYFFVNNEALSGAEMPRDKHFFSCEKACLFF